VAETYLEMSVGDVCDLVEAYTGNTTAEDALAYVIAGYKRFLLGLDPRTRPPSAYFWSFLQPVAALSITSKVTGTASGVYDSGTDSTTITATTDIFYDWQVGSTITVATPVGDLTISAYTSASVIVADEGDDFTTQVVSVQHPGIYDLPIDFGGMIEPPKYHYDPSYDNPQIEEASPEFIMDYWAGTNVQEDSVLYYVLVPASVGKAAVAAGAWQIWVAPRSLYDRTLSYRYVRLPLAISDSKTVFFLGGPMHNETIKELALAEAELQLNKAVGVHEQRASVLMAASIDRDKTLYRKSEPEQMRR
jgi:hypothetical protein